MTVATMTRQDALGWLRWATRCKSSALVCTLTIEQLQEGAEQAFVNARLAEKNRALAFKHRVALSREHANRARNNTALVVALDMLGFDTVHEAVQQLGELDDVNPRAEPDRRHRWLPRRFGRGG